MTGLNEVIKAKLLTSNQVYLGYSLDELLLLRKYKGSIPPSTKGFLTDYFGIKTRFSYFSTANNNMDDQELVVGLPFPDDRVHAEAIEYLAAAKAVDLARDQFVCVELGAGWRPWLALTGTMARKMGIKNVTLVGVEADRKRLAFMKSHFADNDLPVPDDDGTAFHNGIRVKIIHGGISDRSGSGCFSVLGGRLIDVGEDDWETEFGEDRYAVPFFRIEDIIGEYPIVDYLHVDIQGEELKAITGSIDCLNERVRFMHVGTHSRIVEGHLLALLLSNRWLLLHEKPCRFKCPVNPDGDVVTNTTLDGSQVWVNPRLERNLHDHMKGRRLSAQFDDDSAYAQYVLDLLVQTEREVVSGPHWTVETKYPFFVPRHWQGFSDPENWGTWTVGTQARLSFGLRVPDRSDVEFVIKGHALVTGQYNQRLNVEVNGHVIARMILTAESPSPAPVTIPQALLENSDIVDVVLGTPDAVSPKELGMNPDERVLGIGIESISVQAAKNSDR